MTTDETRDRALINRALRIMDPGVPRRVSSRNYALLMKCDEVSLEDLARRLIAASKDYRSSSINRSYRTLVRQAIDRAKEIAA